MSSLLDDKLMYSLRPKKRLARLVHAIQKFSVFFALVMFFAPMAPAAS